MVWEYHHTEFQCPILPFAKYGIEQQGFHSEIIGRSAQNLTIPRVCDFWSVVSVTLFRYERHVTHRTVTL